MNPTFEPNQTPGGPERAEHSLLFPLPEDHPHLARVSAAQGLLFPADPRGVCQEIGLNWWAALKLHEDGWLSFAPELTLRLDESQEAELRFVGSLVMAGCDRSMLAVLLGGLSKPYAYDPRRLYYDWAARRWRLLPEPHTNPEGLFADWLETLVHSRDVSTLAGIDELTHDALSRVRIETHPPERDLYREHRNVTSDEEQTQG